ncbi:MAG TPA: hypothetical protein VNW97_01855 [Candidatus Saccharimonadales bacterium]|jgi:hypothetical protein|nr:hypothetical protein [Candidatus Saccharimonadales bacterium]
MQNDKYCQGKTDKSLAQWDAAICDAEQSLKQAEAKAKLLKSALETFKIHKRLGTPWSEHEKAGTAKEAIPA